MIGRKGSDGKKDDGPEGRNNSFTKVRIRSNEKFEKRDKILLGHGKKEIKLLGQERNSGTSPM